MILDQTRALLAAVQRLRKSIEARLAQLGVPAPVIAEGGDGTVYLPGGEG